MQNNTFSWLQAWCQKRMEFIQKPDSLLQMRTMDNPGWFVCKVRENTFEGACGPQHLPQVLGIFRKWNSEIFLEPQKNDSGRPVGLTIQRAYIEEEND